MDIKDFNKAKAIIQKLDTLQEVMRDIYSGGTIEKVEIKMSHEMTDIDCDRLGINGEIIKDAIISGIRNQMSELQDEMDKL